MRRWLYAVPVFALAIGSFAASRAQAGDICQRLWAERNAIYKQHGYCFHSGRARAFFGNYGCEFYSEYEVPLSYGASARIADLTEREYANGCRGGYAEPYAGYGYRGAAYGDSYNGAYSGGGYSGGGYYGGGYNGGYDAPTEPYYDGND